MLDEMLKKYGLKYEDLSSQERATAHQWVSSLQQGQLSLEKVREYLQTMRSQVEEELTKTGHDSKQDLFLKARLRNYMLLESFLISPEKAKERLEATIASIASPLG